ncbi:MAG: AmmeMemoRadiSam system protein B [Candidatus Omnitrophota bacterium]
MKKPFIATVFLVIFCATAVCSAQQIKMPVVSGTFYPDSPKILAERIKQFLDWAEVEKNSKKVIALISPHAGYDYSGAVAAYGYKLIKGSPYRSVIIIGPSHYVRFDGISVYPEGSWQTPLGNVPVDSELAQVLIQFNPKISFVEPAFKQEHSLEVQLPFLQMVLDNFKIVPIATGEFSYENCEILSQALLEVTKDRDDILVVVSSDLSHYHPYDEAQGIDNHTINSLKEGDTKALFNRFVLEECQACGAAGLISVLLYAQAQGPYDLQVLKYANSGDVTGDKTKVVGYTSAAIFTQSGEDAMVKENAETLTASQKERLLDIARQTIEEYVNSSVAAEFKEDDPLLSKEMGAFVTIHKNGQLRGCIGNIIGRQPLYLTVRDMAIQAAVNDPRFPALTGAELADIDIEISVLTPPKKVQSVDEIKMGVHGVIVEKGFASGVFLPQVATETGWTKEEFLANLCAHKAGLAPLAWQDKDTKLYIFTAQVFGEKEPE